MEPHSAPSISGRIIAEFEDDASAFLSTEPEFSPSSAPALPSKFVAATNGATPNSVLSEAEAAVAKKAWLRVIGRFTEPSPQEHHVRVRGNGETESGILKVECRARRSFQARELDLGDDLFLTLFWEEKGDAMENSDQVSDHSFTLPWTEIVSIHFQCPRSLKQNP